MTIDEPTKALLRDLGYGVRERSQKDGWFHVKKPDSPLYGVWSSEAEGWGGMLAHAESEEGLRANFSRIVRLLGADEMGLELYQLDGGTWRCTVSPIGYPIAKDCEGPTPEAAAWALLKKTRGIT